VSMYVAGTRQDSDSDYTQRYANVRMTSVAESGNKNKMVAEKNMERMIPIRAVATLPGIITTYESSQCERVPSFDDKESDITPKGCVIEHDFISTDLNDDIVSKYSHSNPIKVKKRFNLSCRKKSKLSHSQQPILSSTISPISLHMTKCNVEFLEFPKKIIAALNQTDVGYLKELVYGHVDPCCKITYSSPAFSRTMTGPDPLVQYYTAISDTHPDGLDILCSVRANKLSDYWVIVCEHRFIGTRVFEEHWNNFQNVKDDFRVATFLSGEKYNKDELNELLEVEERARGEGRKIVVFVHKTTKYYVDDKTKKIRHIHSKSYCSSFSTFSVK
jgi:hypothetical protein